MSQVRARSFLVLTGIVVGVLAGMAGCASNPDANTRRVAGGATSIFHQLDANDDGKATYAEFDAGFADAIYAIYNRDANGAITKAEWEVIERANRNKAERSFIALDYNHDGQLTRTELASHHVRRDGVVKRLFVRIDANHDGVLTLEEARAFGIEKASDRDPANHP